MKTRRDSQFERKLKELYQVNAIFSTKVTSKQRPGRSKVTAVGKGKELELGETGSQ